ncbi:efflux RND transporter periplasmic adaptor subunit [Limnohabitans sp.]|uniref:efflux RND transporter periplasmic adaptor subunit n=1 Tax=Limnohabitans sp. TaxID=1907725 RepID=UPI0025BC1EF1|nr:efflux RND transporter periplasmic adaptor subunit [Limnohabitans sp.]
MNHPHSWPARLVLLACILLQACSKPLPAEEPVRAVKVLTVGLDAMQSGAEYAGEVRARVESRLGFRVGGKLLRRHVEMGQHVRAGDLLGLLDPQDFKLAADGARAQLAAATTNRDLALADAKRYKDLREQNFISAAELERRDTALKTAQAQVDQAQAQLAALGNQTAYANLVADVAGVVTSVDAEPGQVLAAGTPILRIAQDGPRDVVFAVPEDKVGKLKVGSQVLVQAWAKQKSASATVREVAASADPVTRTFTVKVRLNGPETWPLGSTVTIAPMALDRSGPSVIKLPTSALQHDGEKAAVWVLEKATMTVRLQPIAITTADGNEVVVSQGLEPGMQVVSVGAHVLNPGQKVTIYQSKQATAAASTSSVPAQ